MRRCVSVRTEICFTQLFDISHRPAIVWQILFLFTGNLTTTLFVSQRDLFIENMSIARCLPPAARFRWTVCWHTFLLVITARAKKKLETYFIKVDGSSFSIISVRFLFLAFCPRLSPSVFVSRLLFSSFASPAPRSARSFSIHLVKYGRNSRCHSA